MHLILLILLLVLPLIHSRYLIGTGRGVIQPFQQGQPYPWTIQEASWDPWDFGSALWNLEKDDRFPNGQFIRSSAQDDLVWDSAEYQFWAGTQIILYPKKDTLYDTKNQRFGLLPNGKMNIMLHLESYVNVSSTAPYLVKLAWDVPNSPYQRFHFVDEYDVFSFAVEVGYQTTVQVTASGPLGNFDFGTLSGPNSYNSQLANGYVVTFKDANGNTIDPSPFTASNQGADRVRIPRNPFPSGARTWSGDTFSYTRQEIFTTTAQLIFADASVSGSGTFSGTGSDKDGSFTINGQYISTTVRFGKVYAGFTESCEGYLNDQGTQITGSWHRADFTDQGSFELNLQ